MRREEVHDRLATRLPWSQAGPGYFSAAMVRNTVRAIVLLEYLLTSRITSASVSDSCV